MTNDDSVTRWISGVGRGDADAARALWEEYFEKLARLARRRMIDIERRAFDEQDVAASAFQSVCRGIANRRFPRLDDRDGLWRLFVTILNRKLGRRRRGLHAKKRDEVRRIDPHSGADNEDEIIEFLSREPTPDVVAEMNEQCDHLLGILEDDALRQVALLKMEGLENTEISERADCSLRTVERRLGLIRRIWSLDE